MICFLPFSSRSSLSKPSRRIILATATWLIFSGMTSMFAWSQDEGARPRREVRGTLRASMPWGCLIEAEMAEPEWVLFQENAEVVPGPGALGVDVGEGAPRVPPLGLLPELNAGAGAGIPLEFAVRVTALLDTIPDGQRVRFHALLDEDRRKAVNPIRYLESVIEGAPEFGLEEDLEEAMPAFAGEEPFEGVVVGRAYRSLTVMISGRRTVIPYTANAVLRFVSNDPRWVAIGDQVEVVGRERPDGMLVATRVRVEHADPVALEALEELKAETTRSGEEVETKEAGTEEPAARAGASEPAVDTVDLADSESEVDPKMEAPAESPAAAPDASERRVRVFGRRIKLF